MKNYIQHDDNVPLTAPSGGVVAGTAYLIGSFFGVALTTAAQGESFELRRYGVVTGVKKTSETWAEGDALYWDTDKLTKTAGSLKKVAIALAVAGSSDTTGTVVLLPNAQ